MFSLVKTHLQIKIIVFYLQRQWVLFSVVSHVKLFFKFFSQVLWPPQFLLGEGEASFIQLVTFKAYAERLFILFTCFFPLGCCPFYLCTTSQQKTRITLTPQVSSSHLVNLSRLDGSCVDVYVLPQAFFFLLFQQHGEAIFRQGTGHRDRNAKYILQNEFPESFARRVG